MEISEFSLHNTSKLSIKLTMQFQKLYFLILSKKDHFSLNSFQLLKEVKNFYEIISTTKYLETTENILQKKIIKTFENHFHRSFCQFLTV